MLEAHAWVLSRQDGLLQSCWMEHEKIWHVIMLPYGNNIKQYFMISIVPKIYRIPGYPLCFLGVFLLPISDRGKIRWHPRIEYSSRKWAKPEEVPVASQTTPGGGGGVFMYHQRGVHKHIIIGWLREGYCVQIFVNMFTMLLRMSPNFLRDRHHWPRKMVGSHAPNWIHWSGSAATSWTQRCP